jgi:hypothetical protein
MSPSLAHRCTEHSSSGPHRWLEYTHNYVIYPILQLFQQLRVCDIIDEMFSHAEQDDEGESYSR